MFYSTYKQKYKWYTPNDDYLQQNVYNVNKYINFLDTTSKQLSYNKCFSSLITSISMYVQKKTLLTIWSFLFVVCKKPYSVLCYNMVLENSVYVNSD